MPISFTTDDTATLIPAAGGDTLIVDHWEWNFGDGSIDSIQNPIHFYANYGNYTVCLTIGSFPTNGNLIYYTFINCDTFNYSPTGWAKLGQASAIEEINSISSHLNNRIFDLLGKEHKTISTIPLGTLYIRNGKKHIKQVK